MNRNNALFLALAISSFAGPATAQSSLTLPRGAASAEQNSSVRFSQLLPINATPRRLHQLVYAAGELAGQGPTTWTQLDLRPDAVGIAASVRYRISVRLSAQGVPGPRDVSRDDRSANRGSDAVTVILPRTLQLPAVPARNDGQPQAALALPFDTPFRYPGGTGLLIEIDWEQLDPYQASVQDFDAFRVPRSPGYVISQQTSSPGCAPAGRFRMTAGTSVRDQDLVVTASFDGPGVDATLPALLAFGGLPAATALDPIGAPGCVVGLVPGLVVVPSSLPVLGGGVHWTNFYLPYTRTLLGASLRGQAWLDAPAANALGIVVSETVSATITNVPADRRATILIFEELFGGANNQYSDLLPVVTLR